MKSRYHYRSLAAAGALLIGAAGTLPAQEEGKVTEGRLDAIGADGKALGPCPLKHTAIEAELSGTMARVSVTQEFHNPFKDKIEAVYVFPLHQDSAVDRMTMKVGDKVVKGIIKERGEAQRIYQEARAAGKVASLLDQERPNIFTQSVANIEPGERVTITIAYSQTMSWEDGRFHFDVPTVVGPRYIPGGSQGAPPVAPKHRGDEVEVKAVEDETPGQGAQKLPSFFRKEDPKRGPEGEAPTANPDPADPTEQVPDADRITPPVVEEGFRAGHDISITVHIDGGREIRDLKSLRHEVDVEHPAGDKTRAVVKLAKKAVLPNRDFAISYRTAGEAITDTILTHTDDRGKFFTLILQPPARVKQEEVVPRELVFVLDSSGSMRGFPMETSKAMMRRALNNLRPRDRFNIVTFAGRTSVLFDKPVANTGENRARALRFVDTLEGAGGTEMMKAINTALGGEHDPETVRVVCFLTDGYVGNDMAIVAAVKEHARTSRVFSFGIGSSVNRFLLDSMATAGRGVAHYVVNHEQARPAADKFYQRIDAPVLTDIELDFGGLEVEEVYPSRIEDLFSAQPVVVKGRYKKGGEARITLKGTNAAGAFAREIPVNLPAENAANEVLAPQWARAKVAHLMLRDMKGLQQGKMDPALKEDITGLGITYNLLTQFTSFVAVEELRITEGGRARTIRVPVEMPEGVSYSGVFGPADRNGWAGRQAAVAGTLLGGKESPALRSPTPAGNSSGFGSGGGFAVDEPDAYAGIQLEQLEEKKGNPNISEEERVARILQLKLEAGLAKRVKEGKGEEVIEVQVILRDTSDEAMAALKEIGFELLARTTSVKMAIGRIRVDKLEALALHKFVQRVAAMDS